MIQLNWRTPGMQRLIHSYCIAMPQERNEAENCFGEILMPRVECGVIGCRMCTNKPQHVQLKNEVENMDICAWMMVEQSRWQVSKEVKTIIWLWHYHWDILRHHDIDHCPCNVLLKHETKTKLSCTKWTQQVKLSKIRQNWDIRDAERNVRNNLFGEMMRSRILKCRQTVKTWQNSVKAELQKKNQTKNKPEWSQNSSGMKQWQISISILSCRHKILH